MGWLGALARRGVTQPIARPVAADDARFLAVKGKAKIAFQVARRSLGVMIGGQRRFERQRIEPRERRLLWIHAEAPQIGDALMDLAPRSLLVEHGHVVDLWAPAPIAALFRDDRLFGRVFEDEAAIDPAAYDLVIVDSRSPRALAAKVRRAPALPWVSIKGDYLAYDYQRGLLAARRLAALLGTSTSATDEARHARQKLALVPLADFPPDEAGTVAIALGGVRRERSYAHWPEVASDLATRGVRRFVLLGSANAAADRDRVLAQLAAAPSVCDAHTLDLVARTDLHGTRRAMESARLVLCADGGLMHLAFTTETPVLAVFDASVDPVWRVPPEATARTLRSGVRDVSAVSPQAIVDAACALLAADRSPSASL